MARKAIRAYPWFGGKYTFLDYLVPMLGYHDRYFEPFMGSAAILLNKPRAGFEQLSDADGSLINLMKCLSDWERMWELIHIVSCESFGKDEFECAKKVIAGKEKSLVPDGQDVRWAADVYRTIVYSFNSLRKSYRFVDDPFANCHLKEVNRRLQGVHIEKRDVFDVLGKIGGGEETVVVLDPPYIEALMGSKRVYRPDFSMDDQKKMLDSIRDMDARIILCGYRTPEGTVDGNGNPVPDVYDEGLKEGNDKKGERRWRCYHVAYARAPTGRSGKRRILSEFVWVNYDPLKFNPYVTRVLSLKEYGSLKLD